MTASLSGVFNLQEFTDAGELMVSGRVYTYTYGTTTHKTAYTDAAGAVAHTYTNDGSGGQYIALNARGELQAPLYLTNGSYDITLKTAAGDTIWTRRADPIDNLRADLAASSGASVVGFDFNILALAVNKIDWAIQATQSGINVLRYIPPSEWAGIFAYTYSYDATADIQTAITAVSADGGKLYAPSGGYKLSTANPIHACLWVNASNVTIAGDGQSTIFKTSANADCAINVSTLQDITNNTLVGTLSNFAMHHINITGTGVYVNYPLGKGIGLLVRNVFSAQITQNWVFGMSMIGIGIAGGLGNYLIHGNTVGNCGYTAINFNGRCYQSIIANNICYNTAANGPDTVLIQGTGHCIIEGNTCFGQTPVPVGANTTGGIMWGEGNYTGVGQIRGNLIKGCSYGIKAIYHGPAQIQKNTIIGCTAQGGIILSGDTGGGFTVGSADNMVQGNLLINNYPIQIDCSAPNTMIDGNKILFITATNPSAISEPDYIDNSYQAEFAIRVAAAGCSVTGNNGRGSARGLLVKKGITLNVLTGNDLQAAAGPMHIESDTVPSLLVASLDYFETVSLGNSAKLSKTISATKPSQGFWSNGDQWQRYPQTVGASLGEVVTDSVDTTTTAGYAGGVSIIAVAGAVSASTGNTIGVLLTSGAYHWTTCTLYSAGNATLAVALPSACSNGAAVRSTQWTALAVL